MKKELQTSFSDRQQMRSKDYELYYYSDQTIHPIQIHAHTHYEFYFLLQGDITMEVEDHKHHVSNQEIVLIPPHIKHRAIINTMDEPYRRYVLWISQDFLNTLVKESPSYQSIFDHCQKMGQYFIHMGVSDMSLIKNMILQLLEEIHDNRYGKEEMLQLDIRQLLLTMNRMYDEKTHIVLGENTIQRIILYIRTHLDEDLSLERLEKELYLSRYYISHLFKENLGISIYQYITKERLKRCANDLRGGATITKVYNDHGFFDYSTFFRAFKKEYGLSPKEYQLVYMMDPQKLSNEKK